jgi:hypothetical protein
MSLSPPTAENSGAETGLPSARAEDPGEPKREAATTVLLFHRSHYIMV